MPDALDFEQPLLEIETRIAELQAVEDPSSVRDEIAKLDERLTRLRQRTFASLTAWQRTQLARHPRRPYMRDWCKLLFDDFVELHGDRLFGDDAAIVGGLARFEGRSDYPETVEKLKALGHFVIGTRQGDAHSIWVDPKTGKYHGAADKRVSGKASGY